MTLPSTIFICVLQPLATSGFDNPVPQRSQVLDDYFKHVSGLQQHRRLSEDANAVGRTGSDDIPRLERYTLSDVRDQIRHFENHLPGVGRLHHLSVQSAFDLQSVRVRYLIASCDERP